MYSVSSRARKILVLLSLSTIVALFVTVHLRAPQPQERPHSLRRLLKTYTEKTEQQPRAQEEHHSLGRVLQENEGPTTVETVTESITSNTEKRYKLAIGVISSFDWEDTTYVTPHLRRQTHRKTWMQHPAIQNGEILVYFFIGNQQEKGVQGNPEDATHDISELETEMMHEADIVLLNSSDVHDYGKMNAWYEWASANVKADYHMKLDVETYVHVDNLLAALEEAPENKFVGGTGWRLDYSDTIREIAFIRGIASIMSEDLMVGLGECSRSGKFQKNDGDYEEVHQAHGLRMCGLDEDLNYSNEMAVYMLTQLLIQGCREDWVDQAIAIHGGSEYSRLADVPFYRLHDIYYPEKGDLSPSWAKWESIRLQFLEDMRVCDTITRSEWACESYEHRHSCLPEERNSVSCGAHTAGSCQLCAQGRGELMCHGDCEWCSARAECMSRDEHLTQCALIKERETEEQRNLRKKEVDPTQSSPVATTQRGPHTTQRGPHTTLK